MCFLCVDLQDFQDEGVVKKCRFEDKLKDERLPTERLVVFQRRSLMKIHFLLFYKMVLILMIQNH